LTTAAYGLLLAWARLGLNVAGGKEKKVFGEEAQDFLEMKIKAAAVCCDDINKKRAT